MADWRALEPEVMAKGPNPDDCASMAWAWGSTLREHGVPVRWMLGHPGEDDDRDHVWLDVDGETFDPAPHTNPGVRYEDGYETSPEDEPWLNQGDDSTHVANILDPVHDGLDPLVFDDATAPDPRLKPELQAWLTQTIFEILERHGYTHPDTWLTLVLTGSLTTYQYSDASDCDISLFIDSKKFPDWSRAEMIAIMVSELDNVNLPGTPHPMQGYVVPANVRPKDLYKPGLRSGLVVYGKKAGKWLVPPDRTRVHDVEHEMNDAYTVGLLSADKLDLLLRFEPDQAIEYWHALHKARATDQTEGNGDFATSNIVFKMLVNRGLAAKAATLAGDRHIPG